MSSDEIIAAAREIVKSQSWPEAKAKLCEHGQSIAAELLRLHDGAEALRAENERLRQSWDLQPDTKIISAGPNELLIETKTGDRRRISMACPVRFDELQEELANVNKLLDLKELKQILAERGRLVAELAEAKAALATQQRCPWERSLDEICPVHGGPYGQCPIPARIETFRTRTGAMTDLFTLADCDRHQEASDILGRDSVCGSADEMIRCVTTICALVAALAEQVQGCPACAGIGYSSKGILCTRCKLERDLLEKMGVKL